MLARMLELGASGESVSGSGGSWSPLVRPVCWDSMHGMLRVQVVVPVPRLLGRVGG